MYLLQELFSSLSHVAVLHSGLLLLALQLVPVKGRGVEYSEIADSALVYSYMQTEVHCSHAYGHNSGGIASIELVLG